ncbi:MAG: glycine dehydrogenase, partial [Maricaulaceae bacterium]
ATSNICTNSGLCCLAFTIHMSLLGDAGLKRLAMLNHEKACDLADRLSAIDGVELMTDTFFNEFTLRLPKTAADVVESLVEKGVIGGVPMSRLSGAHEDLLLVTATEIVSDEDIAAYEAALTEVLS